MVADKINGEIVLFCKPFITWEMYVHFIYHPNNDFHNNVMTEFLDTHKLRG